MIPNERFGRLKVIGATTPKIIPNGNRVFRVIAICDCGKETIVYESKLRSGQTKSCGCLHDEGGAQYFPKGHGHAKHGNLSPTYNSWRSMIGRCRDPRCNGYERYGGAGVTVCERWRLFENFLADMGERSAGLTLDRIDNTRGYSPDNCKWSTWKEQAANRRKRRPRVTALAGQ